MSGFDADRERFLLEAIELSLESVRTGAGGPFGAVIVRAGQVVGRGMNRVTSANDPTAHAELAAIRDACRRLGTHGLQGCEIYASCEPCPMCLGAIYWARLDRLYFAATRHDAAAAGFDDERIYGELPLPVGQRSLPSVQAMRERALVAFDAWRSSPGKAFY
jgi:guanine deaminase